MSPIEIILIALGLSMDSLAVSIASGTMLSKHHIKHFFRIALYMGFFQGFMPLLGWLAGISFREFIQDYDHWVAFVLLMFIGGKMFWDGFKPKVENREKKGFNPTHRLTLLGLAVATSIDALAVGVTFAMLKINLLMAILTISGITFIISLCGTLLGTYFGHKIRFRIELLGGSILMGMGIKILIEHLFFL